MNSPSGGARRPYVRPMAGWWRRDRFFVVYMVREVTAVIVALYAIVLLVGVLRLSQGEAAWQGWLEALRSPLSILFHVVLLAGMIYHAISWFQIMPKTMPMLFVGGKRVTASTITNAGFAAAVLAALVLLAVAWGLGP
jgi:fumarate reductase subunit C